jgi:hypothetical protein
MAAIGKQIIRAVKLLTLFIFVSVMLCAAAVDMLFLVSTVSAGELENNLIRAAMSCDSLKSVRALVEKGANLNARDNDGRTALLWAVWHWNCNADVARFLIEKGADVNAYDKNGKTPLMTAANLGFTEAVRLLVEKGADLNVQDEMGETALMQACGSSPHADVVRILIENGANLNVTNKFAHSTALGNARFMQGVGKADFGFGPKQEKEIGEIVRMLERAGAR